MLVAIEGRVFVQRHFEIREIRRPLLPILIVSKVFQMTSQSLAFNCASSS